MFTSILRLFVASFMYCFWLSVTSSETHKLHEKRAAEATLNISIFSSFGNISPVCDYCLSDCGIVRRGFLICRVGRGDCSPQPLTEPDVRSWLVDVPLAGHAPSKSQRAAFLHWAPHVANHLTSPCVLISVLLRICSPVLINHCVLSRSPLRILPQAAPFPPKTLLSINGTMELSDCLSSIQFPGTTVRCTALHLLL